MVIPLRDWTRRSGSVIASDASRLFVETPQADSDHFECFQEFECVFTGVRWKDDNCLVREKAVSQRLAQCLSPVFQLTFKRSSTRGSALNKIIYGFKRNISVVLPSNYVKIGYSIAVDRNFSGKGKIFFSGFVVEGRRFFQISPSEGNREAILSSRYPFAPWQIVFRFAKPQFWHSDFFASFLHVPIQFFLFKIQSLQCVYYESVKYGSRFRQDYKVGTLALSPNFPIHSALFGIFFLAKRIIYLSPNSFIPNSIPRLRSWVSWPPADTSPQVFLRTLSRALPVLFCLRLPSNKFVYKPEDW